MQWPGMSGHCFFAYLCRYQFPAMDDTFRTRFDIPRPGFSLGCGDTVFMVGSCFSEHIARRLGAAKFDVVSNPAGVVYNPLSIETVINMVSSGRRINPEELCEEPYGGVWSSFLFHGGFSDTDPVRAADRMNRSLDMARGVLERATTVVVTLGTSWVYELVSDGTVAANCHKFPASHFVRRRLTVAETAACLGRLLDGPLKGKKTVFTVSPVRHLKDGGAGNCVSKAALVVAVDEVCGIYPDACYFPAYELLHDDLRDYRFYDTDMVHPSATAVDYVWDRFCGWALSDRARGLAGEMERVNAALGHRPLNPGSSAYADFLGSLRGRIGRLAASYPEVDFSEEFNRLDEKVAG